MATVVHNLASQTDPIASVGPRIRALRDAMSLSLRDLADRSGVSAQMLSQVERGETSPTLAVAAKIAAGLERALGRAGGIELRRGRQRELPRHQRAAPEIAQLRVHLELGRRAEADAGLDRDGAVHVRAQDSEPGQVEHQLDRAVGAAGTVGAGQSSLVPAGPIRAGSAAGLLDTARNESEG